MKNKINIILYGNASQGKTTSLMKLAVLLAGNGVIMPTIQKSIDTLFKIGKGYKDARFIVEYRGLLVYIATGGDSWMISRINNEFFEGKSSGLVDVYKTSGDKVEELTLDDKKALPNKQPDICICACRPSGDGYGAIKSIHSASERMLLDYSSQLWIHKEKAKDNDIQAKEILDIINCSFGV